MRPLFRIHLESPLKRLVDRLAQAGEVIQDGYKGLALVHTVKIRAIHSAICGQTAFPAAQASAMST
jgi:hypothetical protein